VCCEGQGLYPSSLPPPPPPPRAPPPSRAPAADRAIAAGATYEEACRVVEGSASDELVHRLAANSQALQRSRVKHVPPPPKTARAIAAPGRGGAAKAPEPPAGEADELEAILQTGGVATGVGISAKDGETAEMTRLRIQHAVGVGRPVGGDQISSRPRRRRVAAPLAEVATAQGGIREGTGEGEAAGGGGGEIEEVPRDGGAAAPGPGIDDALAWIAAGSLAVSDEVRRMTSRPDGRAASDAMTSEITLRAVRLVQERWRQHRLARLRRAVRAVVRIQAWVRGYRVRQGLVARGVELPNRYLREARDVTRREREYRDRLGGVLHQSRARGGPRSPPGGRADPDRSGPSGSGPSLSAPSRSAPSRTPKGPVI